MPGKETECNFFVPSVGCEELNNNRSENLKKQLMTGTKAEAGGSDCPGLQIHPRGEQEKGMVGSGIL